MGPVRHCSGLTGGVGQQSNSPGWPTSAFPSPHGGGKFHFLQGDKQATFLPLTYTPKSPTPEMSLVGQALTDMEQVVGTHPPWFCPRGTMLMGKE